MNSSDDRWTHVECVGCKAGQLRRGQSSSRVCASCHAPFSSCFVPKHICSACTLRFCSRYACPRSSSTSQFSADGDMHRCARFLLHLNRPGIAVGCDGSRSCLCESCAMSYAPHRALALEVGFGRLSHAPDRRPNVLAFLPSSPNRKRRNE